MIREHPMHYDAGEYVYINLGNGTPGIGFDVYQDPNFWIEILWFNCLYGTDGTVANRNVRWTIAFDATDVFTWHSPVTQPANTSYRYTWSQIGNTYSSGIGTSIHISIPRRFIIRPNTDLGLSCDNEADGDQFSFNKLYYKRWPKIE